MTTAITVLLIDDHPAIREGCRLLLEQFDIHVVAEADNGEQALLDYSQFNPDIVVMDLSLNGMNGLDCTACLIQRYPNAKIVVFSMHDNTSFVTRAIQNGAMAYVLKSDPSTSLVEAIKQVYYQSKPFLSETIANTLVLRNIRPSNDKFTHLSDREYSIFLLLVEGKSRYEIADTLSLTIGTISNHKTKILQKLQAQSLNELTAIAIEANVLKQNQLNI